jgi:hypothetical protein
MYAEHDSNGVYAGAGSDSIEQAIHLPVPQATYFSTLAEQVGMTRQQFIEYLLTQAYAGEARHVYIVERDGQRLFVHAPRGNNFVIHMVAVYYEHRFPWLDNDELAVVREAKTIASTVSMDDAKKFLLEYGFTVTEE